MRPPRSSHWLVLAILLCFGCASRSVDARDYPRRESHAIPQTTDSAFRRHLAPFIEKHPGKSGFALVKTGRYAFLSRMAMVQNAEHTIDIQYYIMQGDESGLAILKEVLNAADRGVRVRILIDDLNMKDAYHALTILDFHPNIEIRGFNPVTLSKQSVFARIGTWLGDFDRYTKRMHNKALIVDNQLAVTGGRNFGDEYFDVSGDFAFSDLDVITAGPITNEISRSFDEYWNHPESFPRAALTPRDPNPQEIAELEDRMTASRKQLFGSPVAEDLRNQMVMRQLASPDGIFTWARGSLVVDTPDKVQQHSDDTESPPFEALQHIVEKAETEFLAVSSYFVPKDGGTEWLQQQAERGIRVTILTNSLASTDVSLVHTGYARHRENLLKAGVELFELKPIPGVRTRSNLFKSASRSSLHAKVYVIDRRYVVLGSMNLDPRSVRLNTEIAVIMDSPILAGQLVEMYEEITAPKASYRLSLEDDGSLLWTSQDKDGNPQVYHNDPKPGHWRRFSTWALGFITPENQL